MTNESKNANRSFTAADARLKELQIQQTELNLANLTYTFYDEVSEDSVKNCLAELSSWSRRFPAKPIILILNSPGGEVIAGLALFDYILKLRSDGHHVTVIVLGMVASMGGILLQAGDTRVMGKYSQLLIHEVSAGTSGILPAMEDSVAFFKSQRLPIQPSVEEVYFASYTRLQTIIFLDIAT